MITLATLEQATAQEVFEQVKKHSIEQPFKSMDEESCLYRDGKGHKCFAGCLIADDEYIPEMEVWSWDSLVRRGLVPDKHKDLIIRVQKIHDHTHPEAWPLKLSSVERDIIEGIYGEVMK